MKGRPSTWVLRRFQSSARSYHTSKYIRMSCQRHGAGSGEGKGPYEAAAQCGVSSASQTLLPFDDRLRACAASPSKSCGDVLIHMRPSVTLQG